MSRRELSLFLTTVRAGFPSPADDYVEKKLNLNDLLVKNPVASFYLRVSGDSMLGAGIHSDDLIIVDSSLEPRHRDIVVASVDGGLTLKRLLKENGSVFLSPENDSYPSIEIKDFENFKIWGVVTYVIHRTRQR